MFCNGKGHPSRDSFICQVYTNTQKAPLPIAYATAMTIWGRKYFISISLVKSIGNAVLNSGSLNLVGNSARMHVWIGSEGPDYSVTLVSFALPLTEYSGAQAQGVLVEDT